MTKTVRDNAVTERLRTWVDENYSGWGRFARLEKDSKIRAYRWRDLCAERQFAAPDMLAFVQTISTEDAVWVNTGVQPPRDEGYPFLVEPPTDEEKATLAGRFNWVIKEWTSPRGAALFQYLETRYQKQVTADDWMRVVLGQRPPTAEMLELVCKERRHFTEWIITGQVRDDARQVDPSDQQSIDEWKKTISPLMAWWDMEVLPEEEHLRRRRRDLPKAEGKG